VHYLGIERAIAFWSLGMMSEGDASMQVSLSRSHL
jgi:hypothetical protein